MKQKYILGIFALGLIAILGIGAVSAFGFGNAFSKDLTDEERMEMQANQEAMKNAIENDDYNSWATLMQDRVNQMQQKINQETFNARVGRHDQMSEFRTAMEELKASGDFSREDVQAIREEYGIEGKGFGKGGRRGKGNCPLAE